MTAWVDAGAGVAGDMLLGALVDAGADLSAAQAAVDAVVPGAVRLERSQVRRAGLRATKVDARVLAADPPHRTWRTVRSLLEGADLPAPVRTAALAVFSRLAGAEGRVHGTEADQVHFHEVGALDAVADVVGACAALHDLGVERLVTSPIATGSGTVRAAHGVLPVPGPAVLEMLTGWEAVPGGPHGVGELATPTGVALITALAQGCGPMPALLVVATGTGAGTRDRSDRANATRVVLGEPAPSAVGGTAPSTAPPGQASPSQAAVLLEATVDDLDPRAWPTVLSAALAAGALDAWLVPVLMKKGRPGHVLTVLADPARADALSELVLHHTSTLGVRRTPVERDVLERAWVDVAVPRAAGVGRVRVKVGHRGGRVVQAMPEFDDVVALAEDAGEPVAVALVQARSAATSEHLVPGAAWPPAG